MWLGIVVLSTVVFFEGSWVSMIDYLSRTLSARATWL
jgi:hypothetical protein